MVVEQNQRPIRTTGRTKSVACGHWRKRQVLRTPDSPFTARSGEPQRRFAFVTSKHRRRAEHHRKHLDRSSYAMKHWP